MKRLMLFGLLLTTGFGFAANGLETISDVRVAPFLQSRWGQKLDTGYDNVGNYCFNYYTPDHDPCGCSAAAMAQVMRYWGYPANAPAGDYLCAVSGTATTLSILAGPYDYENMPLDTREGIPEAQRQAIGKLTYDCAVALHTSFGSKGSSAYSCFAFPIFTDTFGYANAMGYCPNEIKFADIRDALFANFDLGCPVMLNLVMETDQGEVGHQVLADGYGFDGETPYVHLVCGWPQSSDLCDRWYALPDVQTEKYAFTKIDGIVYNIFPNKTGDILSGRVLDAEGKPVANATVTATYTTGSSKSSSSVSLTEQTNEKGIYAFLLEGGKTYTIACQDVSKSVKLPASVNAVCTWDDPLMPYMPDSRKVGTLGNSWGNDLVLGSGPAPTPTPSADDPLGPFAPEKAVNGAYPYVGAVYDADSNVCGTVSLKIGKPSKKGVSKVSGTVALVDGKKYSIKSSDFAINEESSTSVKEIEVKKLGLMDLSIGEKGFKATIACYDGDALTAATTDLSQGLADGLATFSVKGLPSAVGGYEILTNCTADGQSILVSGKKWNCGKAASIKYKKITVKDPETGTKVSYYELQGLDDPAKSNLSGLKLTYTAKTAMFKGSFYLYANSGTAAKPKLKKITATVAGFVVGGKGFGTATIKNVGSFKVDIQ